MIHVLRSYVVGPLEPFAEGFAAELARQGSTPSRRFGGWGGGRSTGSSRGRHGRPRRCQVSASWSTVTTACWRRRSSNGMWMHAVPLVTGNFDR